MSFEPFDDNRKRKLKSDDVQSQKMLEEDFVFFQDLEFDKKREESVVYNPDLIKVNVAQQGNNLLNFFSSKNIWQFDPSVLADYQINDSTVCLFLSMKFHTLNPNYIHERFKKIHNKYRLCVLLVILDIQNEAEVLKELSLMAVNEKSILILAWNLLEAAKYIEGLKNSDFQNTDLIKGKSSTDQFDKIAEIFLSVKGINRGDVKNLYTRFKNFKSIVLASKDELEKCPGIGQKKAENLYKLFRMNICD